MSETLQRSIVLIVITIVAVIIMPNITI